SRGTVFGCSTFWYVHMDILFFIKFRVNIQFFRPGPHITKRCLCRFPHYFPSFTSKSKLSLYWIVGDLNRQSISVRSCIVEPCCRTYLILLFHHSIAKHRFPKKFFQSINGNNNTFLCF